MQPFIGVIITLVVKRILISAAIVAAAIGFFFSFDQTAEIVRWIAAAHLILGGGVIAAIVYLFIACNYFQMLFGFIQKVGEWFDLMQ